MSNNPYDEIIQKLDNELNLLKGQTQDVIMLIEKAMGLCEKIILRMREMVIKNGFCTQSEEIYFFKNVKPLVNSKFIFYTELFYIESYRPKGSMKVQTKYFKNVIQKLHSYFEENVEFCQYYTRNQTYFDHLYFVRGKASYRIHVDNIINRVDPEFSTGYDQTLANIMAHEALIKYVHNEIEKLKDSIYPDLTGSDRDSFQSRLEWTGSNVAAIEMIYALHSARVINNGQVEIIEIAKVFEKMFNIKLDDIYRTFKDIQGRTTVKTKFLDKLKEALLIRLNDLDK